MLHRSNRTGTETEKLTEDQRRTRGAAAAGKRAAQNRATAAAAPNEENDNQRTAPEAERDEDRKHEDRNEDGNAAATEAETRDEDGNIVKPPGKPRAALRRRVKVATSVYHIVYISYVRFPTINRTKQRPHKPENGATRAKATPTRPNERHGHAGAPTRATGTPHRAHARKRLGGGLSKMLVGLGRQPPSQLTLAFLCVIWWF